MKIKKTLSNRVSFLDVSKTSVFEHTEICNTETFNCKKVSVCFSSTGSPSKLCKAQHVRKSRDLLTLATRAGAET